MRVLVCYDVSTISKGGPKRLRSIAKACQDYGQRVQYSVFECSIEKKQWAELQLRLLGLMNPREDSIRIYFLTDDAVSRVEHHGVKEPRDLDGPLII